MCFPNTLQWQWRIYVDFHWLNVRNGCCFGAGRTVGTLVLLRVHLNWAVLLVINAIWCCNVISSSYTSCTTITMAGLHWSSFMQSMSFCPWTNRSYVYIAWIRVLLGFDVAWGRNLTIMRCHAIVEYMERMSYWPSEQTGRTFILLKLGSVMTAWVRS